MNLTIDSNVQNIIFNGNDVQKLIFNGVEVWSKVAEIYENYGYKYLTFEFITSGTWGWGHKSGSGSIYMGQQIYYRKNGGTWTSIGITTQYDGEKTINVVSGDIVEIYGTYSGCPNNAQDNAYHYFLGSAEYILYGNIKSLKGGINFNTEGIRTEWSSNQFKCLFRGCKITDASNLIIGDGDTLPTMQYMFYGCNKMAIGPNIIGKQMNSVYAMFQNCSNMTTGPKLFVQTLSTNSCTNMFYNCSKLNYVEAYFTTTPGTNYTSNWMYGVQTTSGTFVKNSAATWNVTGVNGVPTNWVKTSKSIPYAFYLPYGAGEVQNIVGSDTLTGTIYLSRDGNTWYGKKLSAAQYQDAPTFMSGACAPYNQMFTDKGYTVGSGRLMTTEFNISETGTNLYVKVDNGGAPFMLCFMGSNGYNGKSIPTYTYGGKITSLCSPYWYVMDKFDPDTVFVFGKMFAATADDSYTLVIDKNTTI